MGREALDRGIARYNGFCELAVKLDFMVKNPDGSYEWTERGKKLHGLTFEDIERLGGAEFLANL